MGPETINKLKDSEIHGDFVGHDNIHVNIILFQDSERKFVVTHNADIKPVSYFTGRETELQELRQRIEEGRKSVLVSGMGGIGKTQICRQLFEEYSKNENGSFSHIGYIEYDGDMNSSLQRCLKFKKQKRQEDNLEAAWKELEYLAADGKLLLFVDNVNVPIGEDAGLGRLKQIPGAVVLTSRRTSLGKEFEPYRIGFLSTEQCKVIYERIRYENSGKKVPEEEIPDLEYIIDVLAARHTVTIEFLAHLAETRCWSTQRLREELESKGFRLEYKDEEDKLINIQEEYEKLYDLSVLTEAEKNILEAFSVFPYIPLAAETCNQWLLEDAGVSKDDDVLIGLYRKGWLQFDMEQESYSLHPVFAQFIYEKCKPTAEKHLGLIETCQKCLEIPESGSAIECRKFIPFAENMIKMMEIDECVSRIDFVSGLYNSLIIPEGGSAIEYEEFIPSAEELFERLDIGWGKKRAEFIDSYAYLLKYIAEYKNAEKWYKSSIIVWQKIKGENSFDIAVDYNNLAELYERQGEYNRAVEFYKKSLKICKNVKGENHPDTLTLYNNLAGMYERQGDYEKAKQLCERTLKVCQNVLEENHPKMADSYNQLAYIYEKQGQYEEAEEYYKKSLQIRKDVLGEYHLDTANSYNNMAQLYAELGEYEEAEEYYEKSLQIRKAMLGENHPDTATVYHNMAGLYATLGNYENAKQYYKKSLQIRKDVLGEYHLDTAHSYNSMANLNDKLGEYEEAEEYYEKSLQIHKAMLGENHPDTATVYHNMAGLYATLGNYENAKKLCEKSLKIRQIILGENHPEMANIYNTLGYIFKNLGAYRNAEELYTKSIKIYEKINGENHLDTAIGYNNLAEIYMDQGEYGKAYELIKKNLKFYEGAFGENHLQTAIGYNNLGTFYEHQGEYRKALNFMFKAYKILSSKLGLTHPNSQLIYENIKKTYMKFNPRGDLEQWLEKKMKEERKNLFHVIK